MDSKEERSILREMLGGTGSGLHEVVFEDCRISAEDFSPLQRGADRVGENTGRYCNARVSSQ